MQNLLNYADLVNDTCKPLFKITGASHFSYVEMDQNGNYFWLGSNDAYFEKCIHQQLVNDAPLSILKTYPKPGFYLIDVYPVELKQYSMPVLSLLNHFDYGHSFRILEITQQTQRVLKLYSYDAPLERQDVNHTYINNLDIFKKFNGYFDNKIAAIRKNLCKNKIEKTKRCEFNQLIKLSIEQQENAEQFNLTDLCLMQSRETKKSVLMTPREKEILFWYIKGKTAEETASILKISRRTIERHFENMREKFGCFSKSQIALKAMNEMEM
ncbi:Regulatory protein SdiA [Aquicella lusitana]|uniref:LuxR family transcriptional regulator n=2 Tax=Aquicella lusitana TaxID=254246 RepID=A0A370GC78_9COXI|nr:LuxR family transcriptional regulator [Aquicella lusitana]VVC72313.1 Regulatory protein SdiA [Aquicella lusitana]